MLTFHPTWVKGQARYRGTEIPTHWAHLRQISGFNRKEGNCCEFVDIFNGLALRLKRIDDVIKAKR